MPNIKAAIKWERQTQKRSVRNKDAKSRLKTLFKKATTETAAEVERAFDKAAGKGIIHKNKAARKKSRLAKALSKTAAVPAGKKTAKTAKTRKAAPKKKK